jgi:hypothetical protein
LTNTDTEFALKTQKTLATKNKRSNTSMTIETSQKQKSDILDDLIEEECKEEDDLVDELAI